MCAPSLSHKICFQGERKKRGGQSNEHIPHGLRTRWIGGMLVGARVERAEGRTAYTGHERLRMDHRPPGQQNRSRASNRTHRYRRLLKTCSGPEQPSASKAIDSAYIMESPASCSHRPQLELIESDRLAGGDAVILVVQWFRRARPAGHVTALLFWKKDVPSAAT